MTNNSAGTDDATLHRVACGLLIRDGRVLLAHRAPTKSWYPNVWDLPGGHVEPGETYEGALVRELREELGITVAAPLCDPALIVENTNMVQKIWVINRWEGEPINAAPDEHDRLGWFSLADAAALPLATDEYVPLFLQELSW